MLKSFMGNGSRDRELTEEVRAVLQQLRQERGHCDNLLASARQLGEPIAKAGSDMNALTTRLAELEQRFAVFERVAAHFQVLHDKAERFDKTQQKTEERIVKTSEVAERVRQIVEDLSPKAEMAFKLKERMDVFLNMDKPFEKLRGDADALLTWMAETNEQLGQLRVQHDRVIEGHKIAFGKLEAYDRCQEELDRTAQHHERRVTAIGEALDALPDVEHMVDDVKRRLATVKALEDAVAQKVAQLEAHREAVERATERAENLDQAIRQLDAGVRQQQENATALMALKEQVAGLQSLQEMVLQRNREIDDVQRDSDEQLRAIRSELAAASEEVRKSVERFELERSGLEPVSQQVADLRSAVTDFETRFTGLNDSRQTVHELAARTQALMAQLQTVTSNIGRLDEEAVKVQAIRRDLDEVAKTAQEASERARRIEEAQPALQPALQSIEQLRGADALVKDALEQTQIAANEIARVRQEQAETRSWLTGIEQMLKETQEGVGELRALAPTVEFVQKQAQWANESVASIESRREFVENLHRRLAEVGSLSATLEERGQELQARMEGAEQRLGGLAGHATEAERLAKVISSVASGLAEAERNAETIGKRVAVAEGRCGSVEGLAERMRALQEGLDQRLHALEEASTELHRVSELRQAAAAAAQELDEKVNRVADAIGDADRQVTRVDVLSRQIEARAGGLGLAEKRISEFEQRLEGFQQVEQEIARSVEQLSARQGTIQSLQADVGRMFTVAEQTATNVRSITSARVEIEESRKLLEDVMSQLRAIRDTTSLIDQRKRQMSQAEERLARADALLVDVRSSIELIQGQKVVVDQAVEKSGALRSLLKHAEAMIEELREERDMVVRVRAAVSSGQGEAAGIVPAGEPGNTPKSQATK